MQNGDPKQGQAYLAGGTQTKRRFDFQILDVNIGLVEAVEQHQGIGPGFIQTLRHISHGTEERAEFERNGNADSRFDCFQNIDVTLFQFVAGRIQIGFDRVDIQLKPISTRLLHLLGIVDPAVSSHTVQTGNNRHIDCFRSIMQQLKIAFRANLILIDIRKIAE